MRLSASIPPSSLPTPASAKPIPATGSSKAKITNVTSSTTPSSSAPSPPFPGSPPAKAATTAAKQLLQSETQPQPSPTGPGPRFTKEKSAVSYGIVPCTRTSELPTSHRVNNEDPIHSIATPLRHPPQ